MRAQFVYENLSFERGKDPRSTLDIGLGEERMKKWEKRIMDSHDSFYFFTKTELKAILATLRKAGILKKIFHKYHSDPAGAADYIRKNYGEIKDWPAAKDYRTYSIFVDIDNIINPTGWSKSISPLPKNIRFKKINKKEEHIPYIGYFYSHGKDLESSFIMNLLAESKEEEVYNEYYSKDPNILEKFRTNESGRLVYPFPEEEDKHISIDPPNPKLGQDHYILFRPGKNWVANNNDDESIKALIGAINFYLENPHLWDNEKRDKYFRDLVEKEHNIEII